MIKEDSLLQKIYLHKIYFLIIKHLIILKFQNLMNYDRFCFNYEQ